MCDVFGSFEKKEQKYLYLKINKPNQNKTTKKKAQPKKNKFNNLGFSKIFLMLIFKLNRKRK